MEIHQTRNVQVVKSNSPVPNKNQIIKNNYKVGTDYEWEDEDSINFGKGIKKEKQVYIKTSTVINKSNSPGKIQNNNITPNEYEKSRVDRYLKNAQKSEQIKTNKKEFSDNEEYEKDRINRYLKNAQKAEQFKNSKKELSDNDEKGRFNRSSKSPEKNEPLRNEREFGYTNEDYQKNRVNMYLKNAEKVDKLKNNKQEIVNSNVDFEKDRVNRYLKNAEKVDKVRNNKKELSDNEENEKYIVNRNVKVVKKSEERINIKQETSDNEDFQKERVNRYLKNAQKVEQTKINKQEVSKKDNYEQERINRYIKNSEKVEQIKTNRVEHIQAKSNSQINQNIIRGGGLSDDDEDLVKNIEKGMQRKNQNSKSPVKILEMDMDFENENDYSTPNKLNKNILIGKSNNYNSQIGNQNVNSNQPANTNIKPIKNEVNQYQNNFSNNKVNEMNNNKIQSNVNVQSTTLYRNQIITNNNQITMNNNEMITLKNNQNIKINNTQAQESNKNQIINHTKNQNININNNQIQKHNQVEKIAHINNFGQKPQPSTQVESNTLNYQNIQIKQNLKEKDKSIANNLKSDIKEGNDFKNEGVIKIRDPSQNRDIVKKSENFKEKWLELNDEWEANVKAQTKDKKAKKSVSPVPVSVNSLMPNQGDGNIQKVRIMKVDAPMFDDPSLHIKKSANTKSIRLENLLLGPKNEEEESLKDEDLKNEENLKNQKYNQKKQRLEQQQKNQNQSQLKTQVTKKKMNEEKLNEKDKVFQSKSNVEKDGEKFNIEKKIYQGAENNFTFQITVPEKLAAPRFEATSEVDERVRIAKEKFDKKATEKAIYTGPDPNAKTTEIQAKKNAKEDTQFNLQISGENNMQMNAVSSKITQISKSKTSEQSKLTIIQSQQRLSEHLIKDEQHMYVFKTFKVDKHTFVSDDFHQPMDIAMDIRQAEEEKSKKKEEPKPEPKYLEIKKDIINKEIKKIVDVNHTVVNEPTPSNLGEENQNLGGEMNMGGENMQIPQQKLLENLVTGQKSDNGKKMSIISNFRAEESFFSNNQQNFEEENRMNISRVSRLSKLDIDEVWDNSVIGNSEHDLFNNSTEFKFK